MLGSRKGPRWYFSLRSPYSWFAYREMRARFPDELDAIEWLPYWEPDAGTRELLAGRGIELPLTEMPRAKNLYILQDARRVARTRGLEITWPIDRSPRWEIPHLAYLVAADHGRGDAFVAAAYQARWERGVDICDPAVVAEIGNVVGVDPDRLGAAAEDTAMRERGVEYLARGDRDGVFGVPFFISGREKFWGAERVRDFVGTLRGSSGTIDGESEVQARHPHSVFGVTPAHNGNPAMDGGHAGGCG